VESAFYLQNKANRLKSIINLHDNINPIKFIINIKQVENTYLKNAKIRHNEDVEFSLQEK